VLLYDRRGYAASRDVEPRAVGIGDHVEDLRHLLDHRRAVLFGHSYGGDVALALAQRHPELVEAVVVFEPPLPWLDFWRASYPNFDPSPGPEPTPEQVAERFIRRMIGERRYGRIPAATRVELARDGQALATELASIRRDPPPFDPGLIEAPVVVVWGAETPERHRRGAEWLAKSLRHASIQMVQGAGHNGHRTHSSEVAEIVLTTVEAASVDAASVDAASVDAASTKAASTEPTRRSSAT
jgi:pimeloyl-ACP methyl ester carboxylesterase